MQFSQIANGQLLWQSWTDVPEMEQGWDTASILVACSVNRGFGPGGSFGCIRTGDEPLQEAYFETPVGRAEASLSSSATFTGKTDRITRLSNPFMIRMVTASGQDQTMHGIFRHEGGLSLRSRNLYVREPWFSRIWSGSAYSIFNEHAKPHFLNTVARTLGDVHGTIYLAQLAPMVARTSSEIAAASERLWNLVSAGLRLEGMQHHGNNKVSSFEMTLIAADVNRREVTGNNNWGPSSINAINGSARDGALLLMEALTFEGGQKGTLFYLIEFQDDRVIGTWLNPANHATERLEVMIAR